MPKSYSIRQPRRCGNGAAFYLKDRKSGQQALGSPKAAVAAKVSDTLATYGSRRARRMLNKAMRKSEKARRSRWRT